MDFDSFHEPKARQMEPSTKQPQEEANLVESYFTKAATVSRPHLKVLAVQRGGRRLCLPRQVMLDPLQQAPGALQL
ncbi:hypothetical protein PHISCL_01320 [Aspergillus sclerotialis]|uniref:Uncharacterized protein n=1 Tax=Aspergillus sclerotialis TaxID=2070753 RepID=A0A3A2ZY99_9EURO|nr:hypothetical protein PHISCL_01320 [Aspergillus sclerotialis]